METVRELYNGVDVGPACRFQVSMVLVIAATMRSRQAKVLLSGEGYCAPTVAHMDCLFGRPSLYGVQCILLLQMYILTIRLRARDFGLFITIVWRLFWSWGYSTMFKVATFLSLGKRCGLGFSGVFTVSIRR